MSKVKQDEAEQEVELRLMVDFQAVEVEIRKRELLGNPLWYGLPDLLFGRGELPAVSRTPTEAEALMGNIEDPENPTELFIKREPLGYEETEEQYKKRQDDAVRQFIETRLWVTKDLKKIPIRTIDPLIKFVADLFYQRSRRAILWKPRGGGGSLSASIVLWMFLVYRQMSVLDIAGSQEQSRIVYKYVTEFFDCVPEMKQRILAKPPSQTETLLVTGCLLKAIPATEKQARGKHLPVLCADESCTGEESTDRSLRAAMSTVASEENSVVILLSTFHVPSGLFQEYWDFAPDKGFERFKWDVFDTMEQCHLGMSEATPEDPMALKFCRSCPLTRMEEEKDARTGALIGHRMKGCAGKARKSRGWATYQATIDTKKMHLGSNVFEIEHECERPNWMRTVYPPELVDLCAADEMDVDPDCFKVVGIDWGFDTLGSMALVMVAKCDGFAGVPESELTDHTGIDEIVDLLKAWEKKYGHFEIMADKSHNFNNDKLVRVGFSVHVVDFGTKKQEGIQNVQRYLMCRRLKILKDFRTGLEQMKGLRRTEKGTVVKKNDHFCDALMCALLGMPFDEHWPSDMELALVKERMEKAGRLSSGIEVSKDGGVILI